MEEWSAGAVVFKEVGSDMRHYLLLLNAGHWDFPKGNREEGETELQTVLREVGEEAGLTRISIIFGFRHVVEYYYRRDGKDVHKQVAYLLASTEDDEVRISKEHQSFGWFPYREAMQRASYENSKITLATAERFVRAQGTAGS